MKVTVQSMAWTWLPKVLAPIGESKHYLICSKYGLTNGILYFYTFAHLWAGSIVSRLSVVHVATVWMTEMTVKHDNFENQTSYLQQVFKDEKDGHVNKLISFYNLNIKD